MNDEPKLTLSEGWEWVGYRVPRVGDWHLDAFGKLVKCNAKCAVPRLVCRPILPERRFEQWLEAETRDVEMSEASYRNNMRYVLREFRSVFNLETDEETPAKAEPTWLDEFAKWLEDKREAEEVGSYGRRCLSQAINKLRELRDKAKEAE